MTSSKISDLITVKVYLKKLPVLLVIKSTWLLKNPLEMKIFVRKYIRILKICKVWVLELIAETDLS